MSKSGKVWRYDGMSIAEIVASGVLPFRPGQRPESITRLATSFA
jgi:hypothetical protein